MEISNNTSIESSKQPTPVETSGVIANAKTPELFKRVEETPETTGSMGYTETAGTIASASETAGTIASSGSSGGSVNTIA